MAALTSIALRYVVFLLWICCLGAAQQSNPSAASAPSAAQSTLSVIFTALPKNADFAELGPGDLQIKEDGKAVDVSAVMKLGRLPLHYCLLFDTSRSEAEKLQWQQKEATEVLSRLIRPGIDRGWIVLFDTESRQSIETDDPHRLAMAISQVTLSGGTALYDAMSGCADRMGQSPIASKPELRTMFLFTDGEDNTSHINPQQTGDAVLKPGIRIYAFSPVDNGDFGRRRLSQLAKLTGGRSFLALNDKALDGAISQVTSDLNQLEEATYVSHVGPDGRGHKLELKPKGKDFTILAPEKYFP